MPKKVLVILISCTICLTACSKTDSSSPEASLDQSANVNAEADKTIDETDTVEEDDDIFFEKEFPEEYELDHFINGCVNYDDIWVCGSYVYKLEDNGSFCELLKYDERDVSSVYVENLEPIYDIAPNGRIYCWCVYNDTFYYTISKNEFPFGMFAKYEFGEAEPEIIAENVLTYSDITDSNRISSQLVLSNESIYHIYYPYDVNEGTYNASLSQYMLETGESVEISSFYGYPTPMKFINDNEYKVDKLS